MTDPRYLLLYVQDPLASAAFYADLLGKTPVESSPGFTLFVLDNGTKLGFWARPTVKPDARPASGDHGELGFPVADAQAVDALYAEWSRRGVTMAQTPTSLDFGYTFVGLDPDGHRLRAFALTLP
ncbi:VOC family protein [Pseudomonas sp. RIT-PI-AD]|uniref:VOC family protein n=1 Tax=Pseudomonas sp. RIT-PI-AD TaxID=3035294 RepID=UPI0021DB7601|nr:VOC family protein [Pseudomonas sp. RIT-PI-AD]